MVNFAFYALFDDDDFSSPLVSRIVCDELFAELARGCGHVQGICSRPRENYLKQVFEKRESNLVPIIGGHAVSSAQIGYELRVFDAKTRR